MGKRSVGSVVIQSRKSLCLRRYGVVSGVAATAYRRDAHEASTLSRDLAPSRSRVVRRCV